ncbi:MAG: aspartate kinase, partial [Gammaproteobacteria bacterium]|nr:aspartate kinase [Gammaproteobacteria bacterium]
MSERLSWVVAKYGGTSVSSSDALQRLVERVTLSRQEDDHILIVVSALSGVSNLLESVCETPDKVVIDDIVEQLKSRHIDYCESLNLGQTSQQKIIKLLQNLSDWYGMLKTEAHSSFFATQAKIMALGEFLSSTIVHDFVSTQLDEPVQLIDSTQWLTSSAAENSSIGDQYLNAYCKVDSSDEFAKELAKEGRVVVAQGFIASNSCGETVLLGRGGSDTSAAYFATLARARRLEIWTDVPGMFSANPRSIPAARQLLNLDYREAQEIASTGAKVLHPRCLRPARQAQIPVFVGSATTPEQGGTLIGDVQQAEPQVKAISVREGVLLVAMETSDMWQTPGFLAEAFSIFYRHGLSIDQVSTSETNVTVTLDNLTQGISSSRIELLVAELSQLCRVEIKRNCAAVSIVGREVRTLLSQLSTAFDAFQNRSVHMLTQAANNLNFTFVIEQNDVQQIVQKLHDALISDNQSSSQLGATWSEITGKHTELFQEAFSKSWWAKNVCQLEQLVDAGPCFAYSRQKITDQISSLKSLKSVDRIFYAMKANSFPDILQLVEAEGLGFECVSIAEVDFVFSLFPEIQPSRILFTPNFAPRSEYERALELGVNLTLDNLYPLKQWGEL